MKARQTALRGCYEIQPQVFHDERGVFCKTFHTELFAQHHLQADFAEQYYSVSHHGVLRGLHFQLPPYQHRKLVYCVAGNVFDAVLDLRVNSPTFLQYALFDLSAAKGNMIYVPEGLAHGFYVLDAPAILVYNVSTVYSPSHDYGVRWDSANIPWPDKAPIVSERDRSLPSLCDFSSPFQYQEGELV